MSEKTDARIHTAGDDPDCRARADDWAPVRDYTQEEHSAALRQAHEWKVPFEGPLWETPARHESVDDIHSRQAREKAP